MGMPYVLVVGRGLKQGVVELRDRRGKSAREIPVADAAQVIKAQLEANLEANE